MTPEWSLYPNIPDDQLIEKMIKFHEGLGYTKSEVKNI